MKTILIYTYPPSARYNELFRSLVLEGRRRNWNCVFVEPHPDSDETTRMARLFALLKPAAFVSGFIKGAPIAIPDGIPSVWIDCDWAPHGAPFLRHDNAAFGVAAAKALLGSGTDFAAIGLHRHDWSSARIGAFARTIRAAGGHCRLIRLAARVDNQFDALEPLRETLKKLPRPVSVFAVTDQLAQVTMMAAASLGWKCPGDIRLVGVDDDEVICMGAPVALSSVRPDWAYGGRLAAEVLEMQMRGEKPKRTYVYGAAGVTRRASTREPYHRPKDARVERALAFIAAEYASPIAVPDVVAVMDCSRRLAELRFREETGLGIQETLEKARMDRALVLLRRRDADIAAIPSMCGFRTAGALRAAFRRHTGMSMTEWRANNLFV
ncbi:MAG: substrate-binding domain-containing protein [Kiritimatiellae bacterium]|nr:substrate-binding domain-containing protein [Kiritimatiellia bacterium]